MASSVGAVSPSNRVIVRVRDLSGSPVPRATIQILTSAGKFGGPADGLGVRAIADVPPGRHRLTVSAPVQVPFDDSVTFRQSAGDTLDVYLDVLPEFRGASIRRTSDGHSYVRDRAGSEWIYTREGTRWTVCRAPMWDRVLIDGIEEADPMWGRQIYPPSDSAARDSTR